VQYALLDGVYTTTFWGKSRFHRTNAPDRQELTELVHTISHGVAGFLERKGLTVKNLEPMIGKRNRVYEILNRKRSLTLKMIWKLHKGLGIPAESLIKPPKAHS
jgi:antitoxin component HigA of HigAB toxin-antitoxin module